MGFLAVFSSKPCGVVCRCTVERQAREGAPVSGRNRKRNIQFLFVFGLLTVALFAKLTTSVPAATVTRSRAIATRPCGSVSDLAENVTRPRAIATRPRANANPLRNVRYFAYQIQDQEAPGNIDKLAASHYDLLVIDQTRSVKGQEAYDSKADVARLKASPNSSGGKKIVLSYIDVGEAESYRWYWRSGWRVGSPEWIVAADPDGWDENYPVKYWRRTWKDIEKRYIDRIIADGYDGIYLDWLEAYSCAPVVRAARREGVNTRLALIRFVAELRSYARAKKPGFLLVAQNAPELGAYPVYVNLFDGIGQEDIWYDGGGDPDTGEQQGDVAMDPDDSRWAIAQLAKWKALGKPVFDIEYAEKPANVTRAYSLGKHNGYRTYVTLRLLDRLTSTPPPGY